MHEVDLEELGRTAAAIWLELDPDSRAGTAILAPTHALRARVNEAVREGLEAEGALHGREMVIERLISRGMTAAQKGDIRHYLEGDEVVFHHTLYGGKARAGEVFAIEAIEGERVRLRHAGRAGARGQALGQEAALPAGCVSHRGAAAAGGRRHPLDPKRQRPRSVSTVRARWCSRLAHARCGCARRTAVPCLSRRTMCSCGTWTMPGAAPFTPPRGSTVDNVIAVLDSGHESLADQATLYVELSRARDKAVLLTDDRERLIEELEARTGEAMTALEASGEDGGIEGSPGGILEFLAGGDTPVRAPSEGPVANTKHRGERGELTDLCAALGESRAERERLAELAGAGRRAVWEVEGYAAWRAAATGPARGGRSGARRARTPGASRRQPGLAGADWTVHRSVGDGTRRRRPPCRVRRGLGAREPRTAAGAGIHRFRVAGYGEVISQAEALARHEGVASWDPRAPDGVARGV